MKEENSGQKEQWFQSQEEQLQGFKQELPVVVLQSPSRVWLFATPWAAARQGALSFTVSQSFLKLTSIESMMQSKHLILCHPLLLLF